MLICSSFLSNHFLLSKKPFENSINLESLVDSIYMIYNLETSNDSKINFAFSSILLEQSLSQKIYFKVEENIIYNTNILIQSKSKINFLYSFLFHSFLKVLKLLKKNSKTNTNQIHHLSLSVDRLLFLNVFSYTSCFDSYYPYLESSKYLLTLIFYLSKKSNLYDSSYICLILSIIGFPLFNN